MKILCEVMQVSRSGYYRYLRQQTKVICLEQFRLEADFKALFSASKESYGTRRMAKGMRNKGYAMGRYQARALMEKLGLQVKVKLRYCCTTDSKHNLPVAENILDRQFDVKEPNKVWATDITYLWTQAGWVYLAVVIDLFSRQVVGWALQPYMTTDLVLQALQEAFWRRKPNKGVLHHSDRGSQYASHAYQAQLVEFSMRCSMSRKGNCWDNSVAERFFRSLKSESTDHVVLENPQHAQQIVREYIMMFYNSQRLHSYLGYMSPTQFEQQYFQASV